MAFHVPEQFRWHQHPLLPSNSSDGNNGAFIMPHPRIVGWVIYLQCSDGGGWEHVSVTVTAQNRQPERCPTWDEMDYVKGLCWDCEDCVMQLHPPQSVYRNTAEFVLHLWRPVRMQIPQPPPIYVGIW